MYFSFVSLVQNCFQLFFLTVKLYCVLKEYLLNKQMSLGNYTMHKIKYNVRDNTFGSLYSLITSNQQMLLEVKVRSIIITTFLKMLPHQRKEIQNCRVGNEN